MHASTGRLKTNMELSAAILARRTIKDFRPDPVPADALDRALSAGLWAQNHKLTEPWRFTILGPETHRQLAVVFADTQGPDARAEAERKILTKPLVVAVSQRLASDETQRREDYGAIACAVQNIQLAAWAEGLGMQWSSGKIIRLEPVYHLLGIDRQTEEIVGMLFFRLSPAGASHAPAQGTRRGGKTAAVRIYRRSREPRAASARLRGEPSPLMPTPLINVSNRLPITIDGDDIKKSSGGLVAALEGLSKEEYEAKWIGWPGGVVEPDQTSRNHATADRGKRLHTRFPDRRGSAGALRRILQLQRVADPALHARLHALRVGLVGSLPPDQPTVSRTRSLDTAVGGCSLVWVHDYQLLLLPAMLRAARPKLRIGFFLHTPFPAYDVFRCHPRRRELVEGMLGADLLGFHTFGYLRHFRSAVLAAGGRSRRTSRTCAQP